MRPIGRAAASVGDGGEGVTPPPPSIPGCALGWGWVEDGLMPDLSPVLAGLRMGASPTSPAPRGAARPALNVCRVRETFRKAGGWPPQR